MSGLPKGWVEAPIAFIADIKLGKMLDKEKNKGHPHRYLRNVNVRWNSFDLEDVLEMRFTDDELESFGIRDGDLLVCEGGEPGRCAVWQGGPTDLKFQKALMRLRPRGGVDSFMLSRSIRLLSRTEQLRKHFTGTTIKHLPQAALAAVVVPLPPVAEQKRIVAKLDALNAKSARARTELARIETLVSRYKQAVLSKAFSGELTCEWREETRIALTASQKARISSAVEAALSSRRGARTQTHQVDFSDFADAPTSWAKGVVAVASKMVVGFAFKSEWYSADGIRLLRGANIAPGAIDWSDLKSLDTSRAHEFGRYLVQAGDIVLAMDRPVISTGLKVARVTKEDQGCLLVQRVTRLRASEFVEQSFLWWFLNSRMFLSHSLDRATGSDLPHISGDDISTCPTPIPPLEEQHEIVRRIESAFARIDRLAAEAKRALELVGKLDEAILAKAFRGELVPQDDSDEPAEKLLERIRAERAAAPKAKRGRGRKA